MAMWTTPASAPGGRGAPTSIGARPTAWMLVVAARPARAGRAGQSRSGSFALAMLASHPSAGYGLDR